MIIHDRMGLLNIESYLFDAIFTGAEFAVLLQVRNGRVERSAFIGSVDSLILVEFQVHQFHGQLGLFIGLRLPLSQ